MKNLIHDDFFRSILIGAAFCLSIYFSISDDWKSVQTATAWIIGVVIFGISYIVSVIKEEAKIIKTKLEQILRDN